MTTREYWNMREIVKEDVFEMYAEDWQDGLFSEDEIEQKVDEMVEALIENGVTLEDMQDQKEPDVILNNLSDEEFEKIFAA